MSSLKPQKILTIDIETTGLDPWRDEITMVGLYDGASYTCCRTKEEYSGAIGKYAGWDILGHNLAFDVRFLEVKGWGSFSGRVLHDTQLIAHVIKQKVPKSFIVRYEEERKIRNKSLPKGFTHRAARPLSLKVLAPWFLKVPWFWEDPTNHNNEEYNRKDCVYTKQLFDHLWPHLEREGLDFYTRRLLPWSRLLLDMSLRGISLDMDALTRAEETYGQRTEELGAKLDALWAPAHEQYFQLEYGELNAQYAEMAQKALAKAKDPLKTAARYQGLLIAAAEKLPRKINYQSPDQMRWLLKDYLKLDITKVDFNADLDDDEDSESTGKAVLHKLASQGREDISTFLEWRQSAKIKTAFLPAYRDFAVDGVLHPTFNITGTRTGRTSSSSPNLQQVPSKLYSLFKPRDGMRFVVYDLSGIEAALIALYSNDRTLYGIISSGTSIHDYNAHLLFNLDCPIEKVKELHPRERQTAKSLGFATFYGAGWRRIKTVFQAAGFTLTDEEAKDKLKTLKEAYPEVFKFHRDITQIFEEGGTVENLLGRPVTIADPADAYMRGFNALIQSSASDLNLHACHRAAKLWEFDKIQAHPLLVIHDCILAEVETARAGQAAEILVRCMTDYKLECDLGKIKLQTEGGVSEQWEK
jgi:DNA polymerase I-like protein with 3'-5' exonuclease and polymerase domains